MGTSRASKNLLMSILGGVASTTKATLKNMSWDAMKRRMKEQKEMENDRDRKMILRNGLQDDPAYRHYFEAPKKGGK